MSDRTPIMWCPGCKCAVPTRHRFTDAMTLRVLGVMLACVALFAVPVAVACFYVAAHLPLIPR